MTELRHATIGLMLADKKVVRTIAKKSKNPMARVVVAGAMMFEDASADVRALYLQRSLGAKPTSKSA